MAAFEGIILTSPADGISPSLLLTCGSQRCDSSYQYLFNLPESLDRLACDQKIGMKNVKAVFTPEVSTKSMGGLGSRLFKCARTNKSCAIVAAMGFQEWLAGVRLISGAINKLKLDHFVVQANGKLYCYKDHLIDVAAITQNCNSTGLPKWLQMDGGEEAEGPVKRVTKGKRCISKEEEEEEDEVVLVKEVNPTEKEDDELPEVICIDLASDEEDDNKNDESGEEGGAANLDPAEPNYDSEDDGYVSTCSSDASFIPLFKPSPMSHKQPDNAINKIPRGIVRKEAQERQINLDGRGVKQEEEDGRVGVVASQRLQWCSSKNKKKKKKGKGKKKAKLKLERPQGDGNGPDIVINKAPLEAEQAGYGMPCSFPPTSPIQANPSHGNPEEIVITSSESDVEVHDCTSPGRKRRLKRLRARAKKVAKLDPGSTPAHGPPPVHGPPPAHGPPLDPPGLYNSSQRCGWLGGTLGQQGIFLNPPPPWVGETVCNVRMPGSFGTHGMVPPNHMNGIAGRYPAGLCRPLPTNLGVPPWQPMQAPNQASPKNGSLENGNGALGADGSKSVRGGDDFKKEEMIDSNPVLAYIVNIKSTERLVVVVFVKQITDIDTLNDDAAWKTVTAKKSRVDVIFHLSEMGVVEHGDYKAWAAKLPGKQVVVTSKPGDASLSIGLRHVLDRGVRLNLVAPAIFPLPNILKESENHGEVMSVPPNSIPAWILTSVKRTINSGELAVTPSSQPVVDLEAFKEEVLNVNIRLVRELEALRKIGLINWPKCQEFYSTAMKNPLSFVSVQSFLTSSPEIDSSGAFEYASSIARYGYPPCLPTLLTAGSRTGVFFFGTGCSEPSSWRGGSAILLTIEERQTAMMIDVGEGTFGQMIRYFGEEEARRIVDSIECIWISHQHGDHCLGTAGLIDQRSDDVRPVLVLAPSHVLKHLRSAQKAFGLNAVFVNIKEQALSDRVLESQKRMGLDTFLSIQVLHSCEAYGLILVHADGWKLVFSGDTRPCPLLRQAGRNCTLLIHEATHAPDGQILATNQRHSTWSEALAEGYHMNAYRTILTHFSRRHPNLPAGLTPEELGGSASIAFDGMSVPFALLPFLPRLNPAVHEVLHEIEEGGEIDMSDDDVGDSS